jgi:hypothetical protein
MMEKSSTEQRIFKKGEVAVSARSSPTDKSKPTERQSTETHREVYRKFYPDSTEVAYRECTHEVDQLVTEADFER